VRTESILLVSSSLSLTQITIVLPHPPVYTISQAFVHSYCNVVGTSDEEIHEVATVDFVGDGLEETHHFSGEAQPSVFWRNSDCCNMAMPLDTLSFSLADDFKEDVSSGNEAEVDRAHRNPSSVR